MDKFREESTITMMGDENDAEVHHPAVLLFAHGPDASAIGRRTLLSTDGSVVSVGRDVAMSSSPPIEDSLLSRLHFRIVYDGRSGGHRLGDARSRNGTFVDGSKVTTCLLKHGSVVRAGGTVMLVEMRDAISTLHEQVALAAPSRFPALILGETGSGKERLAQRIHGLSGRKGPMVPVNCAALPREIIASELFGHVKGAFSGAGAAREGLFSRADGGTVFLDEVGDLPLDQQPALLRALQEGKIRPVGSDREVTVDCRILAATNVNLKALVAAGRFREDLYARLAHLVFRMPSLRERRSEILPLLRSFVEPSGEKLVLSPDAAEALLTWPWPLNIRALQALAHTMLTLKPGRIVKLSDLRELNSDIVDFFRKRRAQVSSEEEGGNIEPPIARSELRARLRAHNGNLSGLTKDLSVHRTQLYRWLEQYGLSPDEFR
ncbi:MAG: sigma 54-interacting transcriptional regulator [Polyangiaceae bacterium]|nr:sigma 54-interacting transcriptional regulator [Polyangiaceae bacterium]